MRELYTWLGMAIAPLTLVYATSRSWSGQGDPPHVPLTRVLIVAVALLNYAWLWSQAVALTNQITRAILGVPAVTNGIETMFEVLIAGAALGGLPLIGLLLMGVGGLQLIALIFVKVVLILVGALAFAIGPLMIGLVATERGNALARGVDDDDARPVRAADRVGVDLRDRGGPDQRRQLGGSAVLGSGAGLGRLLGGLLIALAAIAGFWMAIKLTKAFGSLVSGQLAGLLALAGGGARALLGGAGRGAVERRRGASSGAAGAAGSLRGFASKVGGAAPAAAGALVPAGRRARSLPAPAAPRHARSRRPDRRRRRAGIQGHRRRRAHRRRPGRRELARGHRRDPSRARRTPRRRRHPARGASSTVRRRRGAEPLDAATDPVHRGCPWRRRAGARVRAPATATRAASAHQRGGARTPRRRRRRRARGAGAPARSSAPRSADSDADRRGERCRSPRIRAAARRPSRLVGPRQPFSRATRMTPTLRRLDDGTRYYFLTWRQWLAALAGGGLLYVAVRFSPLSQKWTFTAVLLALASVAVAILPLTGNALGLDRYLAAIARWTIGPKRYTLAGRRRPGVARRRAAAGRPRRARRRRVSSATSGPTSTSPRRSCA